MPFVCKKCGNCCRHFPSIGLTLKDIHDAVLALGIAPEEFARRYCRVSIINGWRTYLLLMKPCPFLTADNRCAIYGRRPSACKRYPALSAQYTRARDLPAVPGCAVLAMDPDDRAEPDYIEIEEHYAAMIATDEALRAILGHRTVREAIYGFNSR